MDHETVEEIKRHIGEAVEAVRQDSRAGIEDAKRHFGEVVEAVRLDSRASLEDAKRHFGGVVEELRQDSRAGLEEAKRHFGEVVEESKRTFGESLEDAKRSFGVVVEDLRSDFRLVAESQSLLRDDVDKLGTKVEGIDRKVDGLTQIVQLTYSELTGRLDDHETRIDTLERRQP
jgi:hypothetical protein